MKNKKLFITMKIKLIIKYRELEIEPNPNQY